MVESGSSREALQAELLALFDHHIANFDSYTVVINDDKIGHHARYTTEQGVRLTVAKFRAVGLTMDKVHAYEEHALENATKMNNRTTLTKVGEDGGHPILHSKIKCPFPLTNRSVITCKYKVEKDGVITVFSSGKGCEAHVTANAKAIGKDVMANSVIQGVRFTPFEGGIEITNVICMDIGGSVPDMMKNKMATRNAN